MIKLILLAILAWYVFKATGNLIRALRGQPDRPLGPRGPGYGPNAGQAPGPGQAPGYGSVQRPATPTKPIQKDDVEDARFIDLP